MNTNDKLMEKIEEIISTCVYGKGWVEVATPENFEASKINLTLLEKKLLALLTSEVEKAYSEGEELMKKNYQKHIIPSLISQERERLLGEVHWLIDCEVDGLETNGHDTKDAKNIRQRIIGHFGQRKALSDIKEEGKLHLVEQKDMSDEPHPYCGSKSLKATWSMEEFIGSETKCQKCLDEYHKTSNYQLSGLQPKRV